MAAASAAAIIARSLSTYGPSSSSFLICKRLFSSSLFVAKSSPLTGFSGPVRSTAHLSHSLRMVSPGAICLSTIRCRVNRSGSAYSTLNSGSNFSDRPPTEKPRLSPKRIYEHWWVGMRKPCYEGASKQQMIDCYVQTLAKVLGSEEEAKKKIYKFSCKDFFGFGCEIDQKTSDKLVGLPGVVLVLPDEYRDCGALTFDKFANESQKRSRTSWKDLVLNKTFLEACIYEVTQNGREGSGLKSQSWKQVGEALKNNHNFVADQKVLKNRYDYLKAKYLAWFKLKNKTGNVYDPSRNMFNLSREEWDIECKANKHVESLKTVPLPFPELCIQLFDGVVATGVEGWGPSSSTPIPIVQSVEDIFEVDETSTSVTQQKSKKKAKVSKTLISSEIDEKMLKALSNLVEMNTVPSIIECRKKLVRLGWEKDSILYKWATIIFEESGSYRESWMSIDDDECEDYVRMRGDRLGLKVG